MTAIYRAAGSIGVCAAALLIPLHWHPATLAILVSLIHVTNKLILFELVLSSHFPKSGCIPALISKDISSKSRLFPCQELDLTKRTETAVVHFELQTKSGTQISGVDG